MINKYFSKSFLLLIGLMVINLNLVFAADIWSEPTYTEQWSIPESTEIWTEPTYPNQWTEPDIVKPQTELHEPQTYIKLQIGSKDVKIKDNNLQLDVAPSIINGRTMVPIRFIGEALNATFTWDGDTQQVTFTMEDKTIILFINETIGLVNGKKVELDVPPVIQNGRTLVPLRFISENLELYINYIDETKSIEISDKPLETIETANDIKQDDSENEIVDFEKLYGTWYIWTPGSVTNLYDTSTGGYVTHDYTQGSDQGKIIINTDGTYSMAHAAWAKGIVAEGNWRLSYLSEINGEKIMAIVLQDGLTDVDWAVAPSENGKIRLLYAMRWTDGSATWVFDSELYK